VASAKNRAPAPLLSDLEEEEELELTGAELIDGALRAVIEAHVRLATLLSDCRPGTAKAQMIDRVRYSSEELIDRLAIARRAGIDAAWRRRISR
jgi:hypothetical protein